MRRLLIPLLIVGILAPQSGLACVTPVLGDKRFDKQIKEIRDFERRQNRERYEAAIVVVGILDDVAADPPDGSGLSISHASIQVERVERGSANRSIAVRFIDFDLQFACSPQFVPTVGQRARFFISETGYVVAEEILGQASN